MKKDNYYDRGFLDNFFEADGLSSSVDRLSKLRKIIKIKNSKDYSEYIFSLLCLIPDRNFTREHYHLYKSLSSRVLNRCETDFNYNNKRGDLR